MNRAIRHVAVIGAAGRLGQWVTRDLVEWGYQVRAVDRALLQAGRASAGTDAVSAGTAGVSAGASGTSAGTGSASAGLPDDPWKGIADSLQADVGDPDAAAAAVAGADAVVFVAGLPCDAADPGAALGRFIEAFWLTADAAGRAGAKRLAVASSLGVYGLNRGGAPWQPLYFPLDERHPVQPADLAGLAHTLQEQTAAQLARQYGFASICLRLPQLIRPSGYAALRGMQADPAAGLPGLWTYLDMRDAARALRLALETPGQLLAEAMGGPRHGQPDGGHLALNVVAGTSAMQQPTIELLRSFFPDVPLNEARLPGQAPAVTGARAAKTLGFAPRYGWLSEGGQP